MGKLLTIYVVLSIMVIITLAILYTNCKKNKENLCLCYGAGTRETCRDRQASQQAYRNGWTEYSDRSMVQQLLGGPAWDRVSCGGCRKIRKRNMS